MGADGDRDLEGIWSHFFSRGEDGVRLVLCGERDPRDAPATVFVIWSGLLSCSSSTGRTEPSVSVASCTGFMKMHSDAMLRVARDQDRPALLRSLTFSIM